MTLVGLKTVSYRSARVQHPYWMFNLNTSWPVREMNGDSPQDSAAQEPGDFHGAARLDAHVPPPGDVLRRDVVVERVHAPADEADGRAPIHPFTRAGDPKNHSSSDLLRSILERTSKDNSGD